MCQQVRTGPGMDSLLLCHADAQYASDKESRSVVTLSPLSREIAVGTALLHPWHEVILLFVPWMF